MTRAFPPSFLWGVASAGHQCEGDNVHSDTWFAEQVRPTVFREPSGRACNGYELWREDVDMAAGMGLGAYRFSVEWARVEPVEGSFDQAALDHYAAIADRCRERGMAPVVTFSHFTAPHWFAARGAWLDAAAPDLFARYCRRVMESFGDRIGGAVTLNEPNLPRQLTWVGLPDFVRDLERATLTAASDAAGVPRYRLGNVVLPEELDAMAAGLAAAHRAARDVIKGVREDLPVGLSLAVVDDVVVGDDPSVRDRKRREVYEPWFDVVAEDDFVGVQNYERCWYDAHGAVDRSGTGSGGGLYSGIDPGSLAGAVRYVHDATGLPVLVTEHGMATDDDTRRAAWLEPSLAGLLDAVEDGVPVLGYCHWSLMDNFEWIFGYSEHLGLHEVDRTTFARTPKPSATVYADLVATMTRSAQDA
ncbi:MAG: glycoside hydrolase family 1 protein [Marmoricola sp.]|nr:glycoside hydrolase family 1 protein [Marmoricola sp.]